MAALPETLEPKETEIAAEITTSAGLPQVQTTNRYNPRPDLSLLNDLLEEDDDAVGGLDGFGELLAYRAKASEFAALLKEDSPALNLNLTFKTPSVMVEGGCGLLQNPSYQLPREAFSLARNHVAKFSSSDVLLMDSMVLPPSLSVPHSCVSNRFLSQDFLDDTLFRNTSPVPSHTPQVGKEAGSGLDRIRNAQAVSSPRREKDFWKASLLKPRKEKLSAQKSSSKEKTPDVFIDLNALLLECAHAITSNNTKAAMQVLIKVKQYTTPHGDGAQRLAYYFAEALEARIAGTGWQVYLGEMRQQGPSLKQIFKASWMYMSSCPFAKAFRYFVNQTILEVAKGASTLHIMEYQFTGFQYPSLFQALAARPGGPPLVRLIAGNVPHYSVVSSQMEVMLDRLEQSGRQLTACAASYGVPFHFTAWVGKTGNFKMKDYVNPNRSRNEALAIISVYPLRYINEDLLSPPQKRSEILNTVRAMNPDVFIRGFVTGSYSTPFFSRRFREALYHFECQYDMLDTFIERDNTDRMVFESEILGRAVLNVVACEGTNVVERVQKYNQCYASAKGIGFEQIPLNPDIKRQVQNILKSWHKDYIVSEDLDYLLMGWKGRMLHALATWKSSNR